MSGLSSLTFLALIETTKFALIEPARLVLNDKNKKTIEGNSTGLWKRV